MPPRKLAVFDVDGTLLHSNDADNECFVRAFSDALGLENIDTDWARYEHTTDSGITDQIFDERLGRAPRDDEIARLQAHFLALLGTEAQQRPQGFVSIAGAPGMLARLERDNDWAVALATGGWRASTELKLSAAGFDVTALPAACSEDGPARESIVETAIERARRHHGVEGFARIVSIGDGVWDVRTAAALGLPFVGVAEGDGAARLRTHGASYVVADFTDQDRALNALEEARVPVRS